MLYIENLDNFSQVSYKVYLYLQDTIELTQSEHGVEVEGINESLNGGTYELSNASVAFANKDNWFSQRCALELPLLKKVDIYTVVGNNDYLVFSGIIENVDIEPHIVSLSLTV